MEISSQLTRETRHRIEKIQSLTKSFSFTFYRHLELIRINESFISLRRSGLGLMLIKTSRKSRIEVVSPFYCRRIKGLWFYVTKRDGTER